MLQSPSRFRRQTLAAVAAGLSLGPLAHAQTAEAPAAAPIELNAPADVKPVTLGDDALDLENADKLKGVKKAVLASVAVYVITEASGAATAGAAFRDRNMASASTSLKVTGLDPARLQALADDAHDQALAAFRARGIEVMSPEALKALPEFAALAALGDKNPLAVDAQAGKGTVFSARGLPLFHLDEQVLLNRMVGGLFGAKVEDPYVSLGDKMAGGFRKANLDTALDKLAKASDSTVLMVRLVLTAAQVKAAGGAFSLSASTAARDTLFMPAWTNRVLVHTPAGARGRASLKYALVSETPPGQIVDVTSTGTKVANVATTVVTFAAALSGVGRGVAVSTKDLEMRTTPQWFDAVARPQVQATLEGLAKGLAP